MEKEKNFINNRYFDYCFKNRIPENRLPRIDHALRRKTRECEYDSIYAEEKWTMGRVSL